MRDVLMKLKEGKSVEIPIYDFQLHKRVNQTKRVYGATVILFEGIMTFCDEKIRDLMDVKVFVDTESDIRLARRLMRDISQRGRQLNDVLNQYNKFVKPAYEKYIAPTINHGDIVVPRGGSNKVAINLIVKHVMRELKKRAEKVPQVSNFIIFIFICNMTPMTHRLIQIVMIMFHIQLHFDFCPRQVKILEFKQLFETKIRHVTTLFSTGIILHNNREVSYYMTHQ
jgi:hypothetical protein